MDHEAGDLSDLLDELENELRHRDLCVTASIGCGKEFQGVRHRRGQHIDFRRVSASARADREEVLLDDPRVGEPHRRGLRQ